MSAKDRQVGGDHYARHAIQPIEFIHRNGLGFCEGNVVKYLSRWQTKGGVEDLEKARHYLDLLIEMEQTEPEVLYVNFRYNDTGQICTANVPAKVWRERDSLRLSEEAALLLLYDRGSIEIPESTTEDEITVEDTLLEMRFDDTSRGTG